MSFASYDFLLCLLIGLIAYHALPMRWRPSLLLVYSLAFYLTWSIPYGMLLLGVVLAIWRLTRIIETCPSQRQRRLWLGVGLAIVLGPLFFFKALQPLDGALNNLVGSGPENAVFRLADLVVPLGISFYSFKLLSYLLDVYWERMPAERDLVVLAAQVFFFPQILCGPIQRTDDFAEQLRATLAIPGRIVLDGMVLVGLGFFKKLAADQLSYPVNVVFDNPQTFPGLATWQAGYLFTLQLYLDFSGYSDIAVGLGKLFGIDAPANFAGPLLAGNIQEFWKRWHVSLTGWMRDYVFTPCYFGLRTWGWLGLVLSILVNMVLIGLWHDFKLTFLTFGLLHAAYMIVYVLTRIPRSFLSARVPAWPVWSWLLTFHAVVLAFVIFRGASLDFAWQMLGNLFAQPIHPLPITWATIATTVLIALACQLTESGKIGLPRREILSYGFLAAVMIVLFIFSNIVSVSFLYQKF